MYSVPETKLPSHARPSHAARASITHAPCIPFKGKNLQIKIQIYLNFGLKTSPLTGFLNKTDLGTSHINGGMLKLSDS